MIAEDFSNTLEDEVLPTDSLAQESSETEIRNPSEKRNITVEVIDFLDTYKSLCLQNGSPFISSLQKSLQNAIDGGPVPKKLVLKGNLTSELRSNRLDDDHLESILAPLSNSTFLTHEIGDKGAMNIAAFLKVDLSLAYLSLKSNSIGTAGGIAIAQALQLNESLLQFDISYNSIKDPAGFEFASMLQVNNRLTNLHFNGCEFSAGSIIALSTVLVNNSNIVTFDLTDNRSNFSVLSQTLQNDTIKHLSGMIKQNKHLIELGLGKLGITDWSTIDHLAPALKMATTLKILDLSCNKISRDGAVAICRALHKHQSIKTLKLSCCNILDEGAEAIGLMLANNDDINKLYLEYNGITGIGLEEIAKGVVANQSLNTLALWGNKWDIGACMAFYQLIGGVVSHSEVGIDDDQLPEMLLACNLRKLPASSTGKTVIIDSQKEFSFAPKKKDEKFVRLAKERVDFVIYSVEGVLNVARNRLEAEKE